VRDQAAAEPGGGPALAFQLHDPPEITPIQSW
jgi:hypothetical protein